jgi:prepilin-type N-terminal cleavage/methylation domain-containing protein
MRSKGFTLIELAVVLAIIAVLAAILTPMVTNHLDQARNTRALADTKLIADAINLFKRDLGYYPVFATLAGAKAAQGTTSSYLMGPSTGATPTATLGSSTSWVTLLGSSTFDIVTQLNTTWADAAQNDKNPGHVSFRGPYIGNLDSDPWGNKYVVANLTSATKRAFVISAGPNGILETDPTQAFVAFTCSADDLCSTIN